MAFVQGLRKGVDDGCLVQMNNDYNKFGASTKRKLSSSSKNKKKKKSSMESEKISYELTVERQVEIGLVCEPCKLTLRTTYRMDEQILELMKPLLPNRWAVRFSGPFGDKGEHECGHNENTVVQSLKNPGCKRLLDLIWGACEPLAHHLAWIIMSHLLSGGEGGAAVSAAAHGMALNRLGRMYVRKAVDDVFYGHFKHGFDNNGYAHFGPDEWEVLRGKSNDGGHLKILNYTLSGREVRSLVESALNDLHPEEHCSCNAPLHPQLPL